MYPLDIATMLLYHAIVYQSNICASQSVFINTDIFINRLNTLCAINGPVCGKGLRSTSHSKEFLYSMLSEIMFLKRSNEVKYNSANVALDVYRFLFDIRLSVSLFFIVLFH